MIKELINRDRKVYTFEVDETIIKNKLNELFRPKKTHSQHYLPGLFRTNSKFTASSFWNSSIEIRHFEKDPAYLTGKVVQESGLTKITVIYRPNSIFVISYILFPISGFITTFKDFHINTTAQFILSISLIISGLFFYITGRNLRISLKNKFESFLKTIK